MGQIYKHKTSGKIITNVGSTAIPYTTSAPVGPLYDLLLESDESNFTKDGANYVSQWNDTSGNGNNVEQIGATSIQPLWSSGVDGSPAVFFDGTSDFLKADNPSYLNNLSVICIEFFIKVSGTGIRGIFSAHSNVSNEVWSIALSNDRFYIFSIAANGAALINSTSDPSDGAFNDDTWHHVSVNCDGSTTKVFKDGVEVTMLSDVTGQHFTNGFNPIEKITVGSNSIKGVPSIYYTNGYLDDFSIRETNLRTANFTAPTRS